MNYHVNCVPDPALLPARWDQSCPVPTTMHVTESLRQRHQDYYMPRIAVRRPMTVWLSNVGASAGFET